MIVLARNTPNDSGNNAPESVPAENREVSLRVPAELAGLRLDQALARLLPEYSRSRLQDWVRRARVRVDGATAVPKDKVWGGESIEVQTEPDPQTTASVAQPIPLAIVYEDGELLVVDKPVGLVVHPGSGNGDGTLLNALLHHAQSLSTLPRAGIVHRLDKDTSGLLVVAKTLEAQTDLVRQLQARTVRREYLALVAGVPTTQGVVEAPIGRHPIARTKMAVVSKGKAARTYYRVLRAGAGWSLVECRLETGRTHQIRVHMHSIGHPLIGDAVYRDARFERKLPPAARRFERQALHAARLQVVHPVTRAQLAFEAAVPADMTALIRTLEQDAPAR